MDPLIEKIMEDPSQCRVPMTKRKLLEDMMVEAGKPPSENILVLPEAVRSSLEQFEGEIPEFVRFTPEIDDAFILPLYTFRYFIDIQPPFVDIKEKYKIATYL